MKLKNWEGQKGLNEEFEINSHFILKSSVSQQAGRLHFINTTSKESHIPWHKKHMDPTIDEKALNKLYN